MHEDQLLTSWGWVKQYEAEVDAVRSLRGLTALKQLTYVGAGGMQLYALRRVVMSLHSVTKLHVCAPPSWPVYQVGPDPVIPTFCNLTQLQALHLPICVLGGGSEQLVPAAVGATHLHEFTVDLYVPRMQPPWILSEFVPLFPHVRSIQIHCDGDFGLLQPVAEYSEHLCQLRSLRLRSGASYNYSNTMRHALKAFRLRSLQELQLCESSIPVGQCEIDALQSLTALTSMTVFDTWLARVGGEVAMAMPPSVEKVSLVGYDALHASVYLSALSPLCLNTLVVFGVRDAASLSLVVPELPHLRVLAVSRLFDEKGKLATLLCGTGVELTDVMDREHEEP